MSNYWFLKGEISRRAQQGLANIAMSDTTSPKSRRPRRNLNQRTANDGRKLDLGQTLRLEQIKKVPRPHLAAMVAVSAVLAIVAMLPTDNVASTKAVEVTMLDLGYEKKPGTPTYYTERPLQDLNTYSAEATDTAPIGVTVIDATTDPQPTAAELDGPDAETLQKLTQAPAEPEEQWQNFTIKSGDSLSKVFHRAGLDSKDVYDVINSSREAKQLSRIKPGQQLAFIVDENNDLEKLQLIRSKLNRLELVKVKEGYQVNEINEEPDKLYAFASGTIENSLFATARDAGLNDNLTMELAGIFGWDIDFILDIRSGDSFAVVYEELFLNGEKIGYGEIVAAEFTNQGKTFSAVLYANEHGISHYYTPEGLSMRKEFLRTPVDFARISSHFNLQRRHPILHTIRAHKGTDYAASTGTPVRATGDGKVIHASRKGGYGKTIIIKHGQIYQSLYAHLNGYARGIRVGTRVKQGQIIGYVGSTGLATGPHLHYEFYVNGAVRNPVTVKLPKAQSISSNEKARFLAQTQKYKLQLASYTQKPTTTQVALAKETD